MYHQRVVSRHVRGNPGNSSSLGRQGRRPKSPLTRGRDHVPVDEAREVHDGRHDDHRDRRRAQGVADESIVVADRNGEGTHSEPNAERSARIAGDHQIKAFAVTGNRDVRRP